MDTYEEALKAMDDLFRRDFQFALSTCSGNKPSVRFVDTYFKDGEFWIVTYRNSRKVRDVIANPNAELCFQLYSFSGKAYDMGHPLAPENAEIRKVLIKAFEPWYFAHNDEKDKEMCYVKFKPEGGFFYKDGTAYKVDFVNKTARSFPFEEDIVVTN